VTAVCWICGKSKTGGQVGGQGREASSEPLLLCVLLQECWEKWPKASKKSKQASKQTNCWWSLFSN